eukprot:539606-Prymnesium_polylepis.1
MLPGKHLEASGKASSERANLNDSASGIVAATVTEHATNLAAAKQLGLNTNVMEIDLPRRFEMDLVAPPTSEEEIIRKLADSKCTQSAMWINCGAVAFNGSTVNKAGCAMIQDSLDQKLDSAQAKLAAFQELKASAQAVLDRMRDEQIVSYDDLSAGEPKTLVRFYFTAKGETGIGKYSKVAEQIQFFHGLEEDAFEELLSLNAPIGHVAPAQVESVSMQQLKQMSDSTRQTLEHASTAECEVVLALTGKSGAADGVDEMQTTATITAADAGFESSVLPCGAPLNTLPPLEAVLTFQSEQAHELKGRQILWHFQEGWYCGRILKPATATVKQQHRICNFMIFFEADDEILHLPLYSSNYATGASAAQDTWMLLSQGHPGLVLMPPASAGTSALALMPPNSNMDEVDD